MRVCFVNFTLNWEPSPSDRQYIAADHCGCRCPLLVSALSELDPQGEDRYHPLAAYSVTGPLASVDPRAQYARTPDLLVRAGARPAMYAGKRELVGCYDAFDRAYREVGGGFGVSGDSTGGVEGAILNGSSSASIRSSMACASRSDIPSRTTLGAPLDVG